MPVIAGKLDGTAKGSLLFLRYRLFPSTRFILVFWNLLLILGGIFISFQEKSYLLWLGSIAIVLVINAIAWANFKLHLKTTRQILIKTLS